MPGARVIALGQAAAGDDGVGLAVLESLRERSLSADIELRAAAGPEALIDLIDGSVTTILVDAVLGERPGEVIEIGPQDLDSRSASRLSSHGLGAAQAIDLARVLHGGLDPAIRIVAVTIARPDHARRGLSPEVAAAVPRAAERVLDLLGAGHA